MAEHARLKVNKEQLLCKNGCGFFGNPEWNWYCSKCWREHNTKQEHLHNFDSLAQTLGAVGLGGASNSQTLPTPLNKEQKTSSLQSFIKKTGQVSQQNKSGSVTLGRENLSQQLSKLEDTKRKHVEKLGRTTSNVKLMFKKGKEDLVKSRSPTRSEKLSLPPEAKNISKEFADYLSSRVKKAGIADLSRNIQSFIEKVHKRVELLPIEEISVMVQNFYQALSKRLETHDHFSGLSEDEIGHICDMTERYIMVCCYKPLFCPFSTQDEEKDLETQSRIRSLNWVTASHLECPFKETAPSVRDQIYTAINDILEMDGSKAPQDKLASVVSCSKKIFSVLQAGECEVASADDFLPSLIYILLKANPPRVISNINFITRFANESRLRSGEEGYYFTNFCCGLSFIENLTAASLNLPPAEFDSYMAGTAIPPGSWEASLLMCEGIQTMSHNLKTLADLSERQTKVMAECEALEKEMEEFGTFVSEEVARVMARTTYTIRGPRKPVTVDAISPQIEESLLPPPLTPISLVTTSTEDNSTTLKDSLLSPLETEGATGLPPPLLPDINLAPPIPSPSLSSTYIGFSAQSFSIPSISCNTAATDRLLSPSMLGSPTSFTGSSSSSSSLQSNTFPILPDQEGN